MPYNCNGCGGEFDTATGVLVYGGPTQIPNIHDRATLGRAGLWTADHAKTLCPRCQQVLTDILLSSDLSDHWHKYD